MEQWSLRLYNGFSGFGIGIDLGVSAWIWDTGVEHTQQNRHT